MKKLSPIAIVLLLTLAACRKSDKAAPAPTDCRTATMIVNVGAITSAYSFTYDESGKLSRVFSKEHEINFVYNANGYVARFRMGDRLFRQSTVTTDAQQRPVSAKIIDYLNDGTEQTETVTCEYNSKNELVRQVSQKPGKPDAVTVTAWADGNCMAISENGQGMSLDYYTDKPVQQADIFRISQLLLHGYVNVFNKNLAKSMNTPAYTTNYAYEFDSNGRIVSARLTTGAMVETRSFQYDCD